MFERVGVPVIGVVENMSAFVDPETGRRFELFSSGGGQRLAEELGVPLLGSIPLQPQLAELADEGRPILVAQPDSPAAVSPSPDRRAAPAEDRRPARRLADPARLTSADPAGDPLPSPAAMYADRQDASPPLSPPHDPGITSGPLRPAILRLALPAVGTTLFQVLFNVTDTFWVGRTLGATALAAVSLASYSVWVLVSVGELVGVGTHGRGGPAARRARSDGRRPRHRHRPRTGAGARRGRRRRRASRGCRRSSG